MKFVEEIMHDFYPEVWAARERAIAAREHYDRCRQWRAEGLARVEKQVVDGIAIPLAIEAEELYHKEEVRNARRAWRSQLFNYLQAVAMAALPWALILSAATISMVSI